MSEVSNMSDGDNDGDEVISTTIQEFYKNQTIFITGGTGFIGKSLIEKLLRCCSGISRIYVLIRKKKDQDVHQRLRNFLEDSVFNKVRMDVPDFEKKIVGIAGDISLENFGLSEPDLALIKKNVSIVFHSAATVRLEEPLKTVISTNLQSTITMLNLCKDMSNLKAFIYVSTAYAHCFNNPIIEEKFYDYPTNYREFLLMVNSLSEEVIETITPALTKPWFNTYGCSKACTENFLADESENLPVGIFRPAIVTASAYEPMPGWVDNYNGTTGIIAGIASGVLRTMRCDRKKRIDLVPVDLAINALIACAWDVDMQVTRRGKNMLIYNFASARDAQITFEMMHELTFKYFEKYPCSMTPWYPSVQCNKYKFMNDLYKIFLHSIPGSFIDLVARSIGQKPNMMKLYEKVHKMCDLFEYVCVNEWDVKNENVQRLWDKLESNDKKMFQFTMQGFDWDKYFATYIKGIRVYLFKDDLKTLGPSRMKYKRLYLMNIVMRATLICSAFYTIRKMLEIKRSYKPLYYYQKRCQYT